MRQSDTNDKENRPGYVAQGGSKDKDCPLVMHQHTHPAPQAPHDAPVFYCLASRPGVFIFGVPGRPEGAL